MVMIFGTVLPNDDSGGFFSFFQNVDFVDC